VKDPTEQFRFSFPDRREAGVGPIRNSGQGRHRQHRRQLVPNCHDEAPFFTELCGMPQPRPRDRGAVVRRRRS
jgi:hypothetical protein